MINKPNDMLEDAAVTASMHSLYTRVYNFTAIINNKGTDIISKYTIFTM